MGGWIDEGRKDELRPSGQRRRKMTDGDLRDGSSETQRAVGRRATVWGGGGSTHQLVIMFITRHLKIKSVRLGSDVAIRTRRASSAGGLCSDRTEEETGNVSKVRARCVSQQQRIAARAAASSAPPLIDNRVWTPLRQTSSALQEKTESTCDRRKRVNMTTEATSRYR